MRHTCMTIADIEEVFMLKKNQQTSTLPTYQFIFSPDYWKSAAKQYTFLHIIAIVGVLDCTGRCNQYIIHSGG